MSKNNAVIELDEIGSYHKGQGFETLP